jgi:glucosamine 6-phosphate synthetase-like amidotransferase/phosphosugar isomerase protein
MADALDRVDQVAGAYAAGIATARRTLVVGSGLGRTAAMLGAAKLIETSHVATTACNCEEFLHLQGFGVNAEDAVVVVHDGNRRSELAIEYAVSQGCHTIVIDRGEAGLPDAAKIIELRGSGSSIVDMFSSIAALHVLAAAVAQEKGTNPDIPAGVDLEYVIGLLYTDPVDGWNAAAAQGLPREA